MPETIDLLLVFIPMCEDLVIDSDDEYDSEREEGCAIALQVLLKNKGFQNFCLAML